MTKICNNLSNFKGKIMNDHASGMNYMPRASKKIVGALAIAVVLTAVCWLITCAVKGWNVGDQLSQYWNTVKNKFNEIPSNPVAMGAAVGAGGLLLAVVVARVCYVKGYHVQHKNSESE